MRVQQYFKILLLQQYNRLNTLVRWTIFNSAKVWTILHLRYSSSAVALAQAAPRAVAFENWGHNNAIVNSIAVNAAAHLVGNKYWRKRENKLVGFAERQVDDAPEKLHPTLFLVAFRPILHVPSTNVCTDCYCCCINTYHLICNGSCSARGLLFLFFS